MPNWKFQALVGWSVTVISWSITSSELTLVVIIMSKYWLLATLSMDSLDCFILFLSDVLCLLINRSSPSTYDPQIKVSSLLCQWQSGCSFGISMGKCIPCPHPSSFCIRVYGHLPLHFLLSGDRTHFSVIWTQAGHKTKLFVFPFYSGNIAITAQQTQETLLYW